MKRILFALASCLLCVAATFAQAKKHAKAEKSTGNPDQDFVDFAAQTDMMEAHLAQMAADQADAQAVKDYASMLNTDHTKDYQQLSDAATKAGLTVPKGLDAMHDRKIVPFEKLKGKAFDHQYIPAMISGHTQAIAEYKREANDGQNSDIKNYANTALPVLQKHLDGAKDIGTPKKK